MHVDLEPRDGRRRRHAGARARDPGRRPGVPARRAWRASRTACWLAEPLAARDRHNAADRAAWEAATVVDDDAVERPGRPSRPDHRRPAAAAARGRDPHHRRRGLRAAGRRAASGSGGPARSSGPRRARWATASRRRSRRRSSTASAASWRSSGDGGMGMTHGRGRDGRARGRPRRGDRVRQRALRHDPRTTRTGRAAPTAPGTDLGPVDFAAAARACGARGVRVDTDAAFEPALRTALAASGPTVIQLALDRRWVERGRPARRREPAA